MEQFYRRTHKISFLILLISVHWIITAANIQDNIDGTNTISTNSESEFRTNNDYVNDGDENERNVDQSSEQVNWLPLLEHRIRAASIPKPNSTCIRVLLQSILAAQTEALSALNIELSNDDDDNKQQQSKNVVDLGKYLLYCDGVSLDFINQFIATAKNRSKLADDNNNKYVNSAIILSNVRTTTSTHFGSDSNRLLSIDENTTEYFSWIKSDLTSTTLSEWLLQHQNDDVSHATFVRLQSLDVSDNQITDLKQELFERMPNLRKLNLSQNAISIEHLPQNLFHRLTKLQQLILSKNKLMSIVQTRLHDSHALPARAQSTVNSSNSLLASLSSSSPISSSAIFANMPELYELDLSHNQITDLPRNAIDGLPNLRNLNLSHNQLSIIPFQIFQSFVSLEVLDLSSNRLVIFLDNFFLDNDRLKVLTVHNNTIEKITKNSFHGLRELITLDLSFNRLMSIDRNAFDSLEELQQLNLSNNDLSSLPTTLFYRLQQLRYLSLSRNKFKILSNGIFANQYKLEELIIDETAIQKLNNWISRQVDTTNKNVLKNLRYISMRNNRHLRDIDPILFRNLPAVERFNLTGNKLIALPQEISELTELKHLDISNNDLITIPKQLNTLRLLETVNLLGNNYLCDCQMAWLVEWIADAQKKVANKTLDAQTNPLQQLHQLKCRHGYPGDFLRVLQHLQCFKPIPIQVSRSKMHLLRSDAQLECSFSGNPIPDIIWVTPRNKIIRFYADPDAKPSIVLRHSLDSLSSSNHSSEIDGANVDLERQAKNREKIEYQILKQKQFNFTAANEANGENYYTLLENGTLRVHNVSRKDSGLYICYGYNVMGYVSADIRYAFD